MSDPAPRWRRDFPIRWENDLYVSRRDLAKFLTLGSALLVGANAIIAAVGRLRPRKTPAAARLVAADALAPGQSLLFRYPSDDDPCILVRRSDGSFAAYSQVCTHLSCAVVHRPEKDSLLCPCHLGVFSCSEGVPTAGPPTRRLPRIRLEQRGDELWAVGVEV